MISRKQQDAFERNFERSQKFFVGWFIFVALLSIGLAGLGIWAIVELVLWVTSK